MAWPPLLHRSKHSSPTVTERKPVLFCWQEGKSRMAGPGGYRRQKEGDGRLRPGKLTMILRFLRRSSLNGDSWSIAIRSSSCSPLRERLRPLLSKSPRRAEPSSCRPCSCTQRKTAGQGRRARRFQAATGGRKMWAGAGAGEAKQAEGKWAGEWAYMHADAGLSCEVGNGNRGGNRNSNGSLSARRRLRQKQGRGRRSYPLPSPPSRSLGLVVVAYQVQLLKIKSSCLFVFWGKNPHVCL
jgi:hypothetical protein